MLLEQQKYEECEIQTLFNKKREFFLKKITNI